MADWLTTVQTKNKLPVASPGVASSGGASPQPQGDWLSTKTSGAGSYRPNQLASEIQPSQPVAPKGNIIAQAGKFVGVTPTNIQKAKDFITKEREPITPEQVVGVGKKFFDVIKQTIVNEKTKQEKKVRDYQKEMGLNEYENLTFDQTRDYVSTDMLKKSKEDIAIDLQKLTGKENKNKLDNYRIKNMQDTLAQIDETLAMPPQQRAKKESFITGLAMGRTAGNLAAGILGSLEGVADFIKWRSDVAGYETLASYSGEGAKRIGQWAEEVAPNNPELADELLQGVGSTLTFYLPGAGVSSASARLASISPKLATIFGITASATLEAATESGSTYQSILDEGKTREEADLGASRVFAGNIFFNVVSDKVGLFSDAKGVKKAFTSALAEGSQEAFQEGLQNIAQEKPAGDNVAKSFFIGSVVGGGLGSVVDRVATDPTISDEDRAKLVQFSAELKKAEQDQEALDKIAEESITPSTEKPESEVSEASSRVENQTVYRGSRGEVTEEAKTYERVKVVNTNQAEVIKELANGGNAAAKELYDSLPNKDRVDFTIADPIIREAYQNDFDAIQYNNTQAKQIGTEYHDLADNRFYAQNRDTAQLYAMQKRAGKYEKPEAKEVDQQFDYSSTQLDLPPAEAKGIVDFAQSIPEEQLSKDPGDNYAAAQTGRETEPHITVLYGLDTNNESDVRSIVESSQPIEVTLGKLSIFEQEDQDVLKVDISGPELTALNKKLDGELDTPGKTFDDYKPHITIAYLKKGEAAQYVGNNQFEGKKLTLNELTFSGKDGNKVTIPLTGKTEKGGLEKSVTKKTSPVPQGKKAVVTEKKSEKSSTTEKTVAKKPVEGDSKKTPSTGDYPSVASGLQTKGAEKLDNFELRKPPESGTDEFKLHKKVVELIRKYAQTIGEDYKPRNALGVYYPTTKNIRVNSMNNLSVAAHEIAHFLDYANNITADLSPAIGSKLGDLYVEYYPGAKPSHKDKLKQLEGFATLLQKYVEMPTTITNKYPELVDHFLKPGGEKYNKVIGDILKDLNDIVSEYQGLSSLDKIGSRMTSEGTNIDKDSFLNFWQKLRTQVFDEIYPAEVLAQKAKVAGTATDPSLWIRAYQSISGVINNNLVSDRGYWGFINLQNGFQKKHSFNWKTLLDSTTNRGITDSFATFLIARREHFYFQELDKLEATRDRLEEISKAYQELSEDGEFDRDMTAELSEDFGIDLTELERDEAREKIQMRFEAAEKEFTDLKQILDNDAFDRAEIDAAFEENKDRFADETKMFDVLSREDLDLLHNEDVQLIDNETYSRLKNKEGYASFKRQFYDEIVGEAEATGAVKVGSTKVSSLIARRGSEKTIINPIYSALLNHSEITRKSMRQLVYNQIGKIGSSAVLPTLFQEVPVIPSVDANGRVTFPQEKDPNLIMARDKYKRKAILTDASVKATIDNLLSYKNIDTFVQFYTGLSRMFTAGTTGFYPQFALTNFMVDQITATANSYNKFKPLYTPLAALKAAFQSSKGVNSPEARFYEEYLVMGGERQTFTGWQKLEPDDLFKRITAEKSKMEKAIGLVQKGTDILSIPAAKSELFSRAAEYINARKAGKSQVQALEEAGRVTAPFHHIGAWGAKEGQKSFGATYIRGLPFFNAGLQVLDQTARVAATPSGRQRMTFVTLAVVAAYLTSAMAMGGGSDEQKEQYKDLEAADLASFIYFPNPSGEGLIRIKMSTTFSIPGTLINMVIANKMFSARYDARDVMEASTAWLPTQLQFTKPETILSWLPQIFKPAAYTILNVKDYPTVAPLVNMGLQRKPPALQYNEGTSAFAKKLGELLNVSPIKVDYLLTGYFGRASGFLTGKPGVYNPASSIMRDYYFTSGKRVREFYDISQKVDADYTAYQNWEKGYTDLPKDQVTELYRKKVISDDIDNRLGDYRDLDIEAEPEKAAKLRGEILILIEHLENGTKPRNLGAWSGDAAGRRRKNKPK